MNSRLVFVLSVIFAMFLVGCGSDESLTRVIKQAEEHPNDWMVLVNLSRAYEDRGDYAESIRVTEKILALKPDEHWVYEQLATRYAFNEQFDQATQTLEKALSLAKKEGPEAVQSATQLRDGINLYIHAASDERKELKARMKMK